MTSVALQSGPSNTVDPESQGISDLSNMEPVEDYCAAAGKVVEETVKPNEPSEWISQLISGIDTVQNVIDAFKDVSTFLAINF